MSVLSCDRKGCSNVMCDILVDGTTYICNECAREFIAKCGDRRFEERKIKKRFENFMLIPKLEESFGITAEEFLNQYERSHEI
ncbi:MAG: hypothetical protein EKK64_06870 [Neisseriaceae bacterium]|nr:MAG: hypothetical protein EKK64_06870 [Neisseriaceae bacterium]